MTTLVPGRRHPALDLEPELRQQYASIVGALVGVDQRICEAELAVLRELCATLELSEAATDDVMRHARQGDDAPPAPHMKRFTEPDICHALVIDAADIIYADRVLADAELHEVDALAERVGVPPGQVVMIRRYIRARRDR